MKPGRVASALGVAVAMAVMAGPFAEAALVPAGPATRPGGSGLRAVARGPAARAAASQPAQPMAAAPADSGSLVPPATTPPPLSAAAKAVPQQTRINIAWQVALEAVDFSPGIIDGHFKRKSLMALNEYAARYFPGLQPFDVAVYQSLKVDVDNSVTSYTITDDDAMLVGHVTEDWNEKSHMERLGYESLCDAITEKFHCTRLLLESINPGVNMDTLEPGQTLIVPAIRPFPADNKVVVVKRQGAAYVTVNLAEKTIRVFDKDDKEMALFHCSIARDKDKLPDRDTKVQVIAAPNPNYTFDPKYWPEVHNVSRILTIPPGPRNPVGLAWVGLDLPGYGIHGTPKPELIGKTGSHGCFRLTNWDALKFAGFAREGMAVKIINPDKNPPTE
jgi:lipoprotein-anchoring transpeptidase ErfK/SrfK